MQKAFGKKTGRRYTIRHKMDHCAGSAGERPEDYRFTETKTGFCIRDVHVIVSGGQGNDEEVTEAYAMAQYLERAGIDCRRIIQEDASVNTLENLKFSRKLIADVDTPVGIVSNNFHVYRGCVYAKRAGFKNPFPIAAGCHPLLFPNYFVRECFAVWKLWLKKC